MICIRRQPDPFGTKRAMTSKDILTGLVSVQALRASYFINAGESVRNPRAVASWIGGLMVMRFFSNDHLSRVTSHFALQRRLSEVDSELQHSEARFRALVAATSDAIYEMSPDWSVMRRLEGRKVYGEVFTPDRNWLNRHIPPEDQPSVIAAYTHAIRTKSNYELEHRVRRYDGSIGWILSRAVPMLDEHGQIKEWFGAVIETTERKTAAEALMRNERLASLGRMAATISHEINNPLEALTNLLYLIAHTEGLPMQAREYLEEADAELGRIAHITRQALGFYRESAHPSEVSVDSLVDSAADLVKRKAVVKHVTVEKQFRAHPKIMAIGGELRQVFSNLLLNSIEAVGEQGTIKMRVSRCWSGTGRRSVRVTVADNGTGIPLPSREHVFEPLYTTKGAVGTGLGLWVARQIVEKHDGKIQMRSCADGPRRGSTFSVLLPA
jgi:signal transduction histidine kinase